MTKYTIIIWAGLMAPLFGAGPHWNRHTTAAVVTCAASAFDFAATIKADGPGVYELNPLFRGAGGHPSVVKMSLWKGGVCAASLYAAYKAKGTRSRYLESFQYGQAGLYTWFGIHNLTLSPPRPK